MANDDRDAILTRHYGGESGGVIGWVAAAMLVLLLFAVIFGL